MKTILKKLIFFVIHFKHKWNLESIYNYKIGDRVKYNWKAKICIDTAIKNNVDCVLIIDKIEHKRNETISYTNLDTKEEGGCSAYWLTKIK